MTKPSGHKIDWAKGMCARCGAHHEDAMDWKPCVDGIIGALVDAIQASALRK